MASSGGSSKGSSTGTKARDPSGAGPSTVTDRSVEGGSVSRVRIDKGASVGGTTAQAAPSPGSVPVLDSDLPDTLTNIGKAAILGPLGTAASVLEGVTVDGQAPDPFKGEQVGYQPDRFKGRANLDGVGDPGSASGLSASERELTGQRFGAGTEALVGDPEEAPAPVSEFSDVVLQDRRKPKLGAGTAMLMSA
jgi:hypothetical protein